MDNHEKLLRNAYHFCLAGDRCMEMRKLGENEVEILSIQAIVNYSLSFELHLKYILLRENRFEKKDKIHYTEELFKRLNEEHQVEIIDKFPQLKIKELNELGIEFWKMLKNESDAFVKWRYQHEAIEIIHSNIGFLKDLVKWTNYIAVKYYPIKKS